MNGSTSCATPGGKTTARSSSIVGAGSTRTGHVSRAFTTWSIRYNHWCWREDRKTIEQQSNTAVQQYSNKAAPLRRLSCVCSIAVLLYCCIVVLRFSLIQPEIFPGEGLLLLRHFPLTDR